MLHLLTSTGGRPEALALLAQYIAAQTFIGAARWIVVDDCDPETSVPTVREGIEVQVVRPKWRWQPGDNTQAACMSAGLALVPPDATLLVLEDDDAYLPGHVDTVLAELERSDLVGERVARYYNIATDRFREIPSDRHASLASTGCRDTALADLRAICEAGSQRIDLDLWHGFRGYKALLNTQNVVGIKGMPGRGGIGVGHRPDFGNRDPFGEVLVDWLGIERAAAYTGFRRT